MHPALVSKRPHALPWMRWVAVALMVLAPFSSTVADIAAAPAADPQVDGLLDAAYSWLSRIDPNDPTLYAPGDLYAFDGADTCYWAFVVEPAFNDNVFADSDVPYVTQAGWKAPPGHDFKDLRQSDNAVFDVDYPGGGYSITLDYLTASGGVYSSGQTGNDGSAVPGTPPVSAAATSLHWNMENSGWSDETHSPPYTYNDTPGQYWEWSMIYEFSIPKSAMGGVCGQVSQGGSHNSPSKEIASLASVGDYVWKDMNENGLQDDGGPAAGIAGVRLYLLNAGGTRIRTSFTTATGYYIFSNLPAGTYTVELDASTLPTGYYHVPGLESKTSPVTGIALVAGQQRLDIDFGYSKRGSIGDYVWHDADGQGDQNEPPQNGLAGVRVRLLNGDRTQVLAVAITDAAGYYLFENLLPGDYVVDVNEQDVIVLYGLPALTTNNEPYPYSLAFAEDHRDADFGYWAPPGLVALGDYVWHDFNSNGRQDMPAEEPVFAGVQCISVFLYDEAGAYLGRTDTDSWGIYMFYNLVPGVYTTVVHASDPDLEQINGNLMCSLSDGLPPDGATSAGRAPLDVFFTTSTSLTNPVAPAGTVRLDYDYGISTSPLAVTLAAFDARQVDDYVLLTWETTSEMHNLGFNLYRSGASGEPEIQLNPVLIPSQAPGSTAGFTYIWQDRVGLVAGQTYYYWLEDVALSGSMTLHGPVSVDFGGPTAVTLGSLEASTGAGTGPSWLAAIIMATLAGVALWRRSRLAP